MREGKGTSFQTGSASMQGIRGKEKLAAHLAK